MLVWSKYSLFILLQALVGTKRNKKLPGPEQTKGRIASYNIVLSCSKIWALYF